MRRALEEQRAVLDRVADETKRTFGQVVREAFEYAVPMLDLRYPPVADTAEIERRRAARRG